MAIQFQGADEYKSKINVPSVPQLLENKAKITSARDEYYRRQALARGRDAAMAKLGDNYQGQIDIATVQDYLAKAGKSDLAQPIIGSYTDADVTRLGKDIDLAEKARMGQLMGYLKPGTEVDRVFNPAEQRTEVSTQYGDKLAPNTDTVVNETIDSKYNFLTPEEKQVTPTQKLSTPDRMKTPMGNIKEIQAKIGVKADGIWGPQSQKALEEYNKTLEVSSDNMDLGGQLITAPESKTSTFKLPPIESQSTAVETNIPEQIPSISQAGRGMYQAYNPEQFSGDMSGESTEANLWKYTLPEGEQGQLILAAAKSLGLNSAEEINSAMDNQVNQSFKMPSGPREFLKEPSQKGLLAAQAEYRQAVRSVLDKRAEAKKALAAELATRAQEQFGRGVTKAGEVRAERKQNIDLAELDPKTNPGIWKPVTADGLKRIYDGQAGLQDMEDAMSRYKDNPNLGNLVDFAAAKLKANGQPVTMDAVETFILQSGAIPKPGELKFKKALRDLNVVDLAGMKLLNWIDVIGLEPTPANPNVLKQFLNNAQTDIWKRGAVIEGYTPSAKAMAEARGVGSNLPSKTPDKTANDSKKGRSL